MDDLLNEFLTETNESIALLDNEIINLEQNPNDKELLSNIFRLVHTIKGTCGFLGLPRLESVAHASENILGKFRDGEMEVTPVAVSLILESLDCIKDLLAKLEDTGEEPKGSDQDLIDRLNDLAAGNIPGGKAPAKGKGKAKTKSKKKSEEIDDFDMEQDMNAQSASEINNEISQDESSFDILMAEEQQSQQQEDDIQINETEESQEVDAFANNNADSDDEAQDAVSTKSAPNNSKQDDDSNNKDKVAASGGSVQQSIRVNVDLLENLMTVVSELVLTRNQLLQILRDQNDSSFAAPLQRLNHVTSELQEGVMKTRMQPIGNAWSKLPRIVRDLSLELKKKIDLKMLGAETELDRQVLELIKDPLTHMVRNSADHGLETPKERQASGKNETGQIILNAYHEGGHIIIEIKDDGRGLPVDIIKNKIVEKGLASAEELQSMSDQQIYQFIFKPGFSTAKQVTSVSGRGVGMDVVRTNIEKIGGTIELKSTLGKGSSFTIKIPLTLAIVSALIVETHGEKFAIPQLSVIELVRTSKNSEHRIEHINDVPVLRLRNRLLPLISLKSLLHLTEEKSKITQDAFIVVAKVASNTFGIIVDRVYDTEEIVVKPVSPILRDIGIFSGNTILGDGSVIMILDPNGIASSTGEMAAETDNAHENDQQQLEQRNSNRIAILLFKDGKGAPKAVPLSLIARLEDIETKDIEESNDRLVVQYRGKLMPLVKTKNSFDISKSKHVPVLVFSEQDKTMGLLVEEILDIVEESIDIQINDQKPGVLGSCIIDHKATDVIDTSYYLTQAFPDWFKSKDSFTSDETKNILLVDDSAFFQSLISPLLNVSGYKVTAVNNASKAMDLCEAGSHFDAIISDIEMPGMDGFEFVEKIRNSEHWNDVPVIALSSHSSARDLEKGRKVGFTDYVAKNDREALLNTLNVTLQQTKGAA